MENYQRIEEKLNRWGFSTKLDVLDNGEWRVTGRLNGFYINITFLGYKSYKNGEPEFYLSADSEPVNGRYIPRINRIASIVNDLFIERERDVITTEIIENILDSYYKVARLLGGIYQD